MNSLNDGNLKTGFGDDILLLEPNEYVSLKSRGKALPGSVTAIRNTRNVVIGQVFNKDVKSVSGTFQGQIGSTIDDKIEDYEQISFVVNGVPFAIYDASVTYAQEDVPEISFTANLMVNGLITSPCRSEQIVLQEDEAITPIALTVAGVESGGTWAVSGVAGLTVNAAQIEGTPTAAGTYELAITYTVEVTEGGQTRTKSTKRTIDVTVAAPA